MRWRRIFKQYEELCEKHGRDPKAAERMMLVPYYVDETSEAAKERFAPHIEWFYNKVTSHQVAVAGQPELIKGYELGMSEGRKTREMGYLNFDKMHEFGAAIAADQATCIRQLREIKERFGITELVLWSNVGGLPTEAVEDAMRRTMAEVIPHV